MRVLTNGVIMRTTAVRQERKCVLGRLNLERISLDEFLAIKDFFESLDKAQG